MTDADPQKALARGWLWMRIHGANPAEAMDLAIAKPEVNPRDVGTGVHLADHRAARSCPRPHTDHEGNGGS